MDCIAYLFRNRYKIWPSPPSVPVQNMASSKDADPEGTRENPESDRSRGQSTVPRWRMLFRRNPDEETASGDQTYRARATLGILSDKQTDEVPGEWKNCPQIELGFNWD